MNYDLKEFNIHSKFCISYNEKFTYQLSNFNLVLNEEKNIVYNNDGSFNRVRITENIFVNIYFKNLSKEMKNYIKNFVGEFYVLIENSQKIYIWKDLPKEYAYSKYTLSLSNSEKIIKAKILFNLKDLVQFSSNRKYSNDRKLKHRIDAKYGFYKYKINFSVVNEAGEKFYNATMLIRNDDDGKKYLYDILNIKEKID